ncbi:breast cancer type 2 susceptibility protein homolog [Zeugodacus cucurbitae]|uniref:Breast cancer type 2 susceptibility protein homolog n=1 Tax=Zeugodacus cucurbitae TaxID=28588 RepID=A0A0A1X360_ZEUCU|nr:breast cancer type 2 susceptibility protein homolog [Zeugodacus cucurbitae]
MSDGSVRKFIYVYFLFKISFSPLFSMADESINSSPRKLNNSIHKSRLHRRQKRINATFSKTAESLCKNEVEEENLSCTLLVMYDSDEPMEDTVKEKPLPKVNISYDPFAEQRLLVLADRSKAMPSSSRHFKATQGFEPCDNFIFEPPEPRVDKVSETQNSKTGAFEITDSELLQLCEETEKKTISLSGVKEDKMEIDKSPKTPKAKRETKSIVDLILEDFCSSPQSPELNQSSEESNFNFRFANKPLRTYSRPKRENVIARQNIAEQYTQPTNIVGHFELNDDLLSNDSSTDLSVQEDQTQLIPVKEEIVVLQRSQNLCENLQNLSAYFTQLVEEEEEGEKRQDTCMELVDHQLEENNIDVRQFEEKSSLDNFFTPTKAEDDYMQCEEELVLPETEELCRNSPNEYISNEEEFKGFSSEEDDASVDLQFATKQNCDTLKPNADTNNDEQNDEWYDECDIFAKFDMGIAVDAASSFKLDNVETSNANHTVDTVDACNSAQINAQPATGFRTASNKEVKISAEAQARATSILQNLPPLPINSSYDEELPMEDDEAEDCTNVMNRTIIISKTTTIDNLIDASAKSQTLLNAAKIETNEQPFFVGFTTASRKTITISDEAKQQAARILEQLTPLPQDEPCDMNDVATNNASTSKELFVGFRTASSKTINISKEAQERALKILEQLPEVGMEEEQVDTNKFGGFRTASRKTIQISDEAKKRAARILEDVQEFQADQKENNGDEVNGTLENIQFSEWPMEGEYQMDVVEKVTNENIANEYNINLPGFATASKKVIVISETAKQKAAALLESLPELPINDNLNVGNIKENSETKTLNNLLFSEWPSDQVNEDSALTNETALNGLHKRKRSDSESAQNQPVLASAPQTPTKFICKPICGPRSPLAHIQTTVTHSSLSELAVKTPPDYRARHGIITRKNLLSLNKSNKMNAKSLQPTKESKVGSNFAETPTKRSSATIANEPKSPPVTPIPNLQEFFTSAAISTSTPQPPAREQTHMRTRARKRADFVAAALSTPTTAKATTTATITTPTNDISFKRIDWENESVNKSVASLNASRLSNTSCSNITKLETNPTPKQRIARLRMYGKPPSVSPICMSSTNNCRISGLKRRTRSATKSDHIDQE